MRHPDLPETCDLTELIAPGGSRGFRIAFDNHPCPDAWTEAFSVHDVRLTKALRRGNVPVAAACQLAADPRAATSIPQPRTKVTPLVKRRYEPPAPVSKDAAPIARARQQLAAISSRASSRAPAPEPPAEEPQDDGAALARQHLAQLAAASAARAGNQNAGTTVRPGSAADKLCAGGGSTLAEVVARASANVPGSGGVRWKDGD